MKLIWIPDPDLTPAQKGERGKLGKWTIFCLYRDNWNPAPWNDDPYILCCGLPEIKNVIGHFDSIEKAKIKAEEVFLYWLENAGITGEN